MINFYTKNWYQGKLTTLHELVWKKKFVSFSKSMTLTSLLELILLVYDRNQKKKNKKLHMRFSKNRFLKGFTKNNFVSSSK